ncbi:hypothetical protein PFISCL1PPCAC_15646, partial [Pristionchus fissidentatus]
QNATVLRNVRIEPGELGAVWVTGSEDASVVLDTVVDQVIEGVAVREKFVIVPVYNDTKEEIKFEKHQNIGSWKLVDGSVNGVSSGGGEESPRCRRVEAQGEHEWEAIMEKLIKNRGEAIGKQKGDKELRNKEEVAVEKSEGKEKWKKMQEEEEWVVELVRKWREVEHGKGEKTEIVKIPDSTKKYSMADVIVEEGILYLTGRDHERRLYVPRRERLRLVKEIHESVLVGHVGVQKLLELVEKEYVWGSMNKDVAKEIVNERLQGEREKMKIEYDKKREGNKVNEPRVGDRVYAFRERNGEKTSKLRIWIVIDEKSPLHWMHACPECNREGREAGSLGEECPPAYRHLPIKRVIELAVLIRVVKLDKMTPSRAHKILEDTKRDEKTDVSEHLKEAYRSSLGERVEETTGYGTVILQKGLKNAPQGKSDSVHWEWYAEVTVEWRALLEHLRNREKKVKIVMILWPRSESRGRRNELWAYIKQVTECTAWEVVVIREPSGMDTEHDYEEQLTEMAAEVTERGDIRVLLNECAFVTDGYPISSLHLSHPHLTRSDWERAAGVWRYSGRWIPPPRMVQQKRIEADWNTPNKKESSRELHMSIEKMREELRKKREERMKETVCHECHLKGHFARNC